MELNKSITEVAEQLCREAGVRYRGIQRGFGLTPSLILVDNNHGSTLGVPLLDATAEKIRWAVYTSNERWKRGAA